MDKEILIKRAYEALRDCTECECEKREYYTVNVLENVPLGTIVEFNEPENENQNYLNYDVVFNSKGEIYLVRLYSEYGDDVNMCCLYSDSSKEEK